MGDGGSAMAILIVEDEPHLRRSLARSLAARGFAVSEAASCETAVRAALADRPDLLLLDVNLPDATGWDVLRELRAQGAAIPAVVMSAVPPSPARVREFGPLGVLREPFPVDALLLVVRNAGPPARAT